MKSQIMRFRLLLIGQWIFFLLHVIVSLFWILVLAFSSSLFVACCWSTLYTCARTSRVPLNTRKSFEIRSKRSYLTDKYDIKWSLRINFRVPLYPYENKWRIIIISQSRMNEKSQQNANTRIRLHDSAKWICQQKGKKNAKIIARFPLSPKTRKW